MSGSDITFYIAYTLFDGDLYTEISEDGDVTAFKREAEELDRDTLVSDLGYGIGLSYNDFDNLEVKTVGKVSVITCTEIKDEPLDLLESSLGTLLSDMDATVAIKSADLAIQISDGK